MDLNFRKLSVEHIISAYKRIKNRAILLDYNNTLLLTGSLNVIPNVEAIGILNNLCRCPKNVAFLFDLKREYLVSVGSCYSTSVTEDKTMKQIVESAMKLYTETTDGSSIETKDSSLLWNYADPDFGFCQAKELLDQLKSVLANEPVSVKSGQHIVEVKPYGVNKGHVAEHLLTRMQQRGMLSDFVLCIGDDRSDEDMFEVIMRATVGPYLSPVADVFAYTVGQKCSNAKYYVED
ncbi:hypothetical protein V6N11_058004 [Hibiscus sabdariffa]|uniref:Trehalose 6-phosphate phosphatase n=1 Tax=Hibiscus sabdariffa TaxID=183260 RepID=A0ABR2P4D9_9ROSI